tara:strand:+ start:1089 stop:1337 length:249 start_codon:yes stop_codon:yes gene_type:complete
MKTVTVTSNNKDDAYTATVLFFKQVAQMSAAKIGNWSLAECYTNNSDQHFITEYTNGKIFVKAVSVNGEHTYSLGEIELNNI